MNDNLANRSSTSLVSIDDALLPVRQVVEPLEKGQNLLVKFGDRVSVLKFDGADIGSTNPLIHRVNRGTSVYAIGNLLRPQEKDPSKRVTASARVEFLGTHRIDFSYDKELGLHLPSAENNTDLYLTLANSFADGETRPTHEGITFIADEGLVVEELQKVTRPEYFERNIVPFLESRATDLSMPDWVTKGNWLQDALSKLKGSDDPRKPAYGRFNLGVARKWLSKATEDLEHGSFVYVGSPHEVYLMGVAKDEDGSLAREGTLHASTKPILFFSNNYLGHMSKGEMNMPLFEGEGAVNVAVYRTSDVPRFNGEPFIFSAMGRRQNMKNHLFTGEPELITGNLEEALEHFRTTDFSEFSDVVSTYARKIHEPILNQQSEGKYLA